MLARSWANLLPLSFGDDDAGNSASDGEFSGDAHPAGVADGGEFVEKSVSDGFIENALIAEGVVVELEGFEFDASFIGDVFEFNGGEIREPGFWADGGELWTGMVDGEIAVGGGVGESF